MENKKYIIIIFLISVVLIAGCNDLGGGKINIKSDQQAGAATSNLTDNLDKVSTDLKDISRTLGR